MKYLYLFIAILLACGNPTPNAKIPKGMTLFQSFASETALPIHIKADLGAILLRKATAEKYSATLNYKDRLGYNRSWKVSLTPRGNMRNKHCLFPPLKLDVIKADLETAGFDPTFDDLKMVIPCKTDPKYQNLVLKEYLAYKLYNEITDLSFRVQLIDLTLEDYEGLVEPIKGKAFLIEKDDELAKRLNGRILKPTNADRKALDASIFDQMCLFQFMIGNTDWYVQNKHNIKLLLAENYSSPLPIPYDFDYAGLVDADYATPHKEIPIQNVKERYYLGPCRDKATFIPTLSLFKNKKENILTLCKNFTKSYPAILSTTPNYIQQFYTILEDDAQRAAMIEQHCDRHIKR